MGDDAPEDSLRGRLARAWPPGEAGAIASAAARIGTAQGGAWGTPPGLTSHPDLLHLNIGIPDAASLPRAELSVVLQRVLEREDDAALRYDLGKGHAALREQLAAGLRSRGADAVDAEQIQLCSGASGALDLVVRALIDPGDVIFAEAPAYLGTLRNFRGVLADVRSLPMDEQGLCVDALADAVRACKRDGLRPKLVYTIPTHHNPTGRTLSLPRRRALLELCASEGLWVIDDDTYGELGYDASASVPLLTALSGGHGVITVGSLSKVLATGLRVGYVHARPDLMALLQHMRFEMGHSPLLLEAIAALGARGVLAQHLARMRGLYARKMQVVATALEREAGRHLAFERPAGGFYLWASLREGLTAEQVWRAGHREGVAVSPGYDFFADGRDPSGEHVRIAFSWTPLSRLEEAAQRLARACQRVADGDLA
jgi:2-aminoadipate transaminase